MMIVNLYVGLLLLIQLNIIYGRTTIVSTSICFSNPLEPITLVGAVIHNIPEKGQKDCFYIADANSFYSVKINDLNLQREGDVCPRIAFKGYQSTVRKKNEENRFLTNEVYEVPDGVLLYLQADCTNYTKLVGQIFESKAVGYKFWIEYNPVNTYAPKNAYNVTFTSFKHGASFECGSNYFRCWSDKYRCIPSSMECDGYDNCFDNSDEDEFRCTNRIKDIPLPLFILIIIVCLIVFICLCMAVVFYIRNRRQRLSEKQQAWIDMNMHPQHMEPRESYNEKYVDNSDILTNPGSVLQ